MTRTDPMLDSQELLRRRAALDSRTAEAPEVAKNLRKLRAWQAGRLARTYEDLLTDERCGEAVEFFLTDLYGPQDFSRRDGDLLRVWSRFKRVLPDSALEVLQRALTLQLLSEELDQAMAKHMGAGPVTGTSYSAAYREVGRADARRRQIDLLIDVGEDLDRLVRRSWIATALRIAHGPAHAAGFGALQDFLERGFAGFSRMRGAKRLLDAIRQRETRLMEALFSGSVDPFEPAAVPGASVP